MSDNRQDPLIESLMALAVSAAPLIKRARDSGIFKAAREAEAASEAVVEASVVPPAPAPAMAAAPDVAERAALQDIIVSQAMKIARLEAEVARLTGLSGASPGSA